MMSKLCDFDEHLTIIAAFSLALVCLLLWKVKVIVSYLSTSLELVKVISYYLSYYILQRIQSLYWRLNGVQGKLDQAVTDAGYENCVQVRQVKWRLRFPTVNHPRPWDFLSLHESFRHPRYLLNHNVTLYTVTVNEAFMVETDEKINVYSSRTSPFMKRAQFTHARKLLVIPMKHFHRLAHEVGDPSIPVAWISNSGRCGSTLVLQMLETVPDTRCISEPDVTTTISVLHRTGHIDDQGLEKLLRTTVRYICKETSGVQRIIVKARYTCVSEVDHIIRMFPSFRHVYIYRDLGHVMMSFYKLIHRDLAVCLLEVVINNQLLQTLLPQIRTYLLGLVAIGEFKDKLEEVLPRVNFMGYATAIVCSNITVFRRMLQRGEVNIPTLHYDDLMQHPLAVTHKLFEELSIPSQYAGPSLEVMLRDSQEGDFVSNIGNNDSSIRKVVQHDIDSINVVLKALNLPDMDSRFQLSNVLNNP